MILIKLISEIPLLRKSEKYIEKQVTLQAVNNLFAFIRKD